MIHCMAARHRRRRALACTLGLMLGLSACSPDGRTDGVAAEKANPIHRTDRFQAVTRSGDMMVAVGAFGVVATSTDGGSRWSRTVLPDAPPLIDVAACGDGSLAALDFSGRIWRGDGAAKDWTALAVPATDALLAATCTADNRLWAVGARGAIFTSADGGKTWDDKSLPEDIQLLNVTFPTASSGVISGEFGRVLLTGDGGATWTEGGSLGADFYPLAMHFPDPEHGLVVGIAGAFLETSDGGKNWTRSKAPTEAPLYGVMARPAGGAVVVGAAGSAFSLEGGQWRTLDGLPKTDLRGIAASPAALVIAGSGVLVPVPATVAKASAN